MTVRAAWISALSISFLSCILLANYVTSEHGMIPVGLGLTATAGTYFAGVTFILRDSLQDLAGKYAVLAIIVAGALLSYLIADPFIALASGVAFACSEVADLLVYTPLRTRGHYIRAAIASNTVGAIVDTLLFLWIAGFPIAGAWQGQLLAKLTMTGIAVLLVLTVRGVLAVRRERVDVG